MLRSQDPGSLVLIVFACAAISVVFWRTIVKLIAICALALLILGFLEIAQNVH